MLSYCLHFILIVLESWLLRDFEHCLELNCFGYHCMYICIHVYMCVPHVYMYVSLLYVVPLCFALLCCLVEFNCHYIYMYTCLNACISAVLFEYLHLNLCVLYFNCTACVSCWWWLVWSWLQSFGSVAVLVVAFLVSWSGCLWLCFRALLGCEVYCTCFELHLFSLLSCCICFLLSIWFWLIWSRLYALELNLAFDLDLTLWI